MVIRLIEIALLAMAAGIVQAVSGFGNAIVMMLGFPGIFGINQAASLAGSIGMFNNGTLTLQYRRHIHFRKTAVITAIYTLISIVSINLADILRVDVIGIIYGIFMILLAAYFILLDGKISLSGTFWMIFSATISGIGSGLFSIGGPLLAVYYNQIFDSREEYLGNLQCTFFICGFISFITRIIKGMYTADLIIYTIAGIIFIYIGQVVGIRIADVLKPRVLKIIIYALVLCSGIMTVIKYI